MTERPYTNARVSKDGRWHVVIDTPSVIATPDGAISIAWDGNDEKYSLRAETVAAEVVDAMNRRADPSSPLGALAMREAVMGSVAKALSPFTSLYQLIADDVATIPLPTHAALLAAALKLPEVAALVGALEKISKSTQYLPGYGSRIAPTYDATTARAALTALDAHQ